MEDEKRDSLVTNSFIDFDSELQLDSGACLKSFRIAYQTCGRLNAEKSNAILVCHGLTADQYMIGPHPVTGKPGWWEAMVGRGKILDTDRYFVICSNVLGGCLGSSGPSSLDLSRDRPYGLQFPMITIHDMVRSQAHLIDFLGISRLFAVVGGSMGGMQALAWAATRPERMFAVVPIACSWRHSAQNIAFHEVGRQAIMADPKWQRGDYYGRESPAAGLSVARMAAHVTYLSEAALHRKFGRRLQDRQVPSYGFGADFQIESYLRHQGSSFVARFDANSYLYITRAMDYFDLTGGDKYSLSFIFRNSPVRFCLISFSSDWLFPTQEVQTLLHALHAALADVSFVEITSDSGHDAFLLHETEFHRSVGGFLQGCALRAGITKSGSD